MGEGSLLRLFDQLNLVYCWKETTEINVEMCDYSRAPLKPPNVATTTRLDLMDLMVAASAISVPHITISPRRTNLALFKRVEYLMENLTFSLTRALNGARK